MSGSATPTYDQMMQPTLNAMHALGGQASLAAINEHVLQQLALDPEVAERLHLDGPMTEVEYRLHWTRTYLKEYGLIDNVRRGYWVLTAKGQACTVVDSDDVVKAVKTVKKAEQELPRTVLPGFQNVSIGTKTPDDISELAQEHRQADKRSLTPDLPTYAHARTYLKVMDGVQLSTYRTMVNEIWAQRGNPQAQVEWAEPEVWIPERLSNNQQELALRIWRESSQTLNPRYLRGAWYLTSRHDLFERDPYSVLRISGRGRRFIADLGGDVEAEIDRYEGILTILRLVADKGPGRRSEFLVEFSEYARAGTTFQSENAIKGALYDRLRNLVDRDFIAKRGQQYEVTDAGLAYLAQYVGLEPGISGGDEKQSDILKLAKGLRVAAREQLQAHLLEMNPFKFEDLIKFLLEEMGYDNVRTTSPTNDKGVDVVGDIELGISSVREVIQVKRHRGNINRVVMDSLRGSLHRFNAVRGTIITTGRFSKGVEEAAFERGAAPITLIDGEKLLDLLMEYEIGVTKKAVEYYEFAVAKLAQFAVEQDDN